MYHFEYFVRENTLYQVSSKSLSEPEDMKGEGAVILSPRLEEAKTAQAE